MIKADIVNVVATATVNQKLDLEDLARIDGFFHDPAVYGGRVAYFSSTELVGKVTKLAARILGNAQATQFISWWNQKQSLLGNTPLWKKRNINFHRGRLGTSNTITFSSGMYTLTTMTITTTTTTTTNVVNPQDFLETLVPGPGPIDVTTFTPPLTTTT